MNIERLIQRAAILIGLLCLIGTVRAQDAVPICWPKVALTSQQHIAVLDIPKGFRESRVAFWTCQTATGYVNANILYKDVDLAQWVPLVLSSRFTPEAATAACAKACTLQYEDNLVAAVNKLSAPYLAKATVAANGTATTRPVYQLNPDGTRGAEMEGVRVAVGAHCYLNGRVGSTGSWYRIDGDENMFTPAADKIGTAVAQCTVTLPLGVAN